MQISDWFETSDSTWVRRVGMVVAGVSESGIVVETQKGAIHLYIGVQNELWQAIKAGAKGGESVGKLVNEKLKGHFQERVLSGVAVCFEPAAPLDIVRTGLLVCNARGWLFS